MDKLQFLIFIIITSVARSVMNIITPPPIGSAEYCYERLSVCLCVCLCVCPRSYRLNYTSDLYHILCMLAMAVARSSTGGVVIRYVILVLWMTSYLHIS